MPKKAMTSSLTTSAPPTVPAGGGGAGGFLGILITVGVLGAGVYFAMQSLAPRGMQTESIQKFEQLLADEAVNAINEAKYRWSCSRNYSSCNITFTADRTYTCAGGGRIHTSGTWGGPITTTNSRLTIRMTQTITDWACITPWVINGDPYLSVSGDISASSKGAGSMNINNFGGWLGKTTDGRKQSCQSRGTISYSNQTGGVYNSSSTCVPGGTITTSGRI